MNLAVEHILNTLEINFMQILIESGSGRGGGGFSVKQSDPA